jgi:hypothetical protein
MSKFAVVKSAPEFLEKGELVINPPNFLHEVELNIRKAPRNKQTALNHLREILQAISFKYDPDMDVFKIKLANYEGLPFESNAELSAIMVRLLGNEYPAIFDKYLTYELKNRPMGTKLVYYTGDFNSTSAFYQAGLDFIEEKDIESYMTGKPKKVVGKPAVSKVETNDGQTT